MTNKMVIAEYDEIRAGIDKIKEAADFIPDASTKDGYDKSKRVSLDVGKVLTALDKKRKDKKAYFLAGGKEVDAQAKEIREQLETLQLPHKEAYKTVDQAKKEAEAARIDDLEARVAELRDMPEMMRESTSSEVKEAYDYVRTQDCLDFYEFTEQALKARNASTDELSKMFERKEQEEADAEELAKLRAQQEEAAQKQRDEEIAQRAAAEANERAAAAERAAKQAKIDADNAVMIAERKAAEDHERARDAEAAELARREADLAHTTEVMASAKDALIAHGLSVEHARGVVLAIKNGAIPNVTINF